MTLYSLLLKILKDGVVTTSFDKEFHAVIQNCEKKWLRTFILDLDQYSLYTCPRVEQLGEMSINHQMQHQLGHGWFYTPFSCQNIVFVNPKTLTLNFEFAVYMINYW